MGKVARPETDAIDIPSGRAAGWEPPVPTFEKRAGAHHGCRDVRGFVVTSVAGMTRN
jgi:hypothetical protein